MSLDAATADGCGCPQGRGLTRRTLLRQLAAAAPWAPP
jgi:hypothetical protein